MGQTLREGDAFFSLDIGCYGRGGVCIRHRAGSGFRWRTAGSCCRGHTTNPLEAHLVGAEAPRPGVNVADIHASHQRTPRAATDFRRTRGTGRAYGSGFGRASRRRSTGAIERPATRPDRGNDHRARARDTGRARRRSDPPQSRGQLCRGVEWPAPLKPRRQKPRRTTSATISEPLVVVTTDVVDNASRVRDHRVHGAGGADCRSRRRPVGLQSPGGRPISAAARNQTAHRVPMSRSAHISF